MRFHFAVFNFERRVPVSSTAVIRIFSVDISECFPYLSRVQLGLPTAINVRLPALFVIVLASAHFLSRMARSWRRLLRTRSALAIGLQIGFYRRRRIYGRIAKRLIATAANCDHIAAAGGRMASRSRSPAAGNQDECRACPAGDK